MINLCSLYCIQLSFHTLDYQILLTLPLSHTNTCKQIRRKYLIPCPYQLRKTTVRSSQSFLYERLVWLIFCLCIHHLFFVDLVARLSNCPTLQSLSSERWSFDRWFSLVFLFRRSALCSFY